MTAAGVGSEDGEVGRAYWSRWEVPVCALIILLPAVVAVAVICRARPSELRGAQLWSPCWRGVKPAWLLGFRIAVVIVMVALLTVTVLQSSFFVFYFYTQWTFTLVIIYFAIAAFISAHGCWICSKQRAPSEENNKFIKRDLEESSSVANTGDANRSWSYYGQRQNDKKAGYLGYAMQIIYQTCAGAVMLTDIVFWCILLPFQSSDHFKVDVVMTLMHSVNLVFLLLDTALNSMPFPAFRMAYFVVWSCIFVTFQWILHACGFTWWPYPFLELATSSAPLWYLGIALVHIPCFGFYYLVVKAKQSLFPKLFPNSYINPLVS